MAEELFALLNEAKAVYLHDVVTCGKQYRRYVEDFVNSHRYIDCDKVVCRNCHEMNIHIVKGLLTECFHLIQPLFSSTDLSFEECMELKRKYDTLELELMSSDRNPAKFSSLSFDCSLSREQLAGIASCANTYHLFCSPVTIDDMESLFTCKSGFCLRVNSVRRVAVLFDALLENSFIQPYWQSVLERGRFLRSKDGSHFISATSISTTLSLVRNKMTSAAYNIRKFVNQLKE
ncbi:hypothetical protein ACTQXG_19410 [Parabacteroides distasonis]|uniref:hypothetical protein n=1 Tax=Parabacteroides distasonis TaxID=823 RepID=UPI003F9A63AE